MKQGLGSSHDRARIERLESLVKRLLAGAAAAGSALTSFAGPIVANQAAATALPAGTYTTARQVYTLAQEAIWQYIPGVAGATGVPPLAADEVITAVGGVLARTSYSSPKWRTGVNDVFIDPANPAASNENDGFTALTPLLTGYELHRRWGWDDSKPIVGPNFATSPDAFTHIHVQSDLVSPDSLPIKITVAHDATIQVEAPLLAANILRTAVLTNVVTPQNRAVPLGGTRLTIRDNTLATWAVAEAANRRVRFLDGPAVGGTLQPQTDTVATPGEVQCSPCQTTNPPAFDTTPTLVTPAVGNTYVVERLVVVNLGEIDIDEELNPSFGGFNPFVNFVNINLPSTGNQEWTPRAPTGINGPFLNFYQCTIDRTVDSSLAQLLLIACYGTASVFSTSGGKNNGPFLGGGWNAVQPGVPVQVVLGGAGIELGFDFDTCFNRATIVGFTCPARNVASWNATPAGGVNAGGHGFLIGGGGAAPFFGFRGAVQCKGTLWGNTATAGATGVLIGASCSGVGAPQNCTGPASDFKLANKVVGWWFNDATVVYNPIGGSVPTTWAALAAAEGAAGFGGNAHELDSNTHWVAAETTA